MKKIFIITTLLLTIILPSSATVDKYSKEYLLNNRHFSIINPFVESFVERAIKSEIKKQTGVSFKVKFDGYTTESIKKGIFKNLEISGKNFKFKNIPVKSAHFKSTSDYNYIDYTKSPIEFKSDMKYAYNLELTEESINSALENDNYKKVLAKINRIAYPLFNLTNVSTKVSKDKLYIITEYNVPISKKTKIRKFVASTELKVENGQIKAKNVHIDSIYGNLGLDKVANLINLLNPLEFTLDVMESKECSVNVENVNIIDNIIEVDGRIFIKGDNN